MNKGYKESFIQAMNDDLNTPQALASIYKLIKIAKKEEVGGIIDFILEIDNKILGLNLDKEETIPENIQKLAGDREKARKEKDWELSDKIRAQIEKHGYTVEDTTNGPIIKKK
jgi:cysteinyl-tRNA synthetase